MNTLILNSVFPATAVHPENPGLTYATPNQTAQLLQRGLQYRRERLEAADMLTTDQAAHETGTTRVTINAWIKSGRCIGLSNLRRGYKLPRWQFEPAIWPVIEPLTRQLGTTDGWQLLSFLESPSQALDGKTPRSALEQGLSVDLILALAVAQAH